MKIKVIKLTKKEFGTVWAKHIKVFFFAFHWFGVQISFKNNVLKKNEFDALAFRDTLDKQYNKNCFVCKKPLFVTAAHQEISYHKECRKLRHGIKLV